MKHFTKLLLVVMVGLCTQLSAMHPTLEPIYDYTTIHQAHRGYSDYIPMDIAYIPSLFSVRHQMARYGIEKSEELEGSGYEFAQLSDPVFADVATVLRELKFDIQSMYILKLNPRWRGNATTVIVTNSCLFIDEDEWLSFDRPECHAGFAKIVKDKGWDVADPIREIKKYVLKRSLAHYKNGTYCKKITSKLLVGAALGLIIYKTMPQVTDYISQKNDDIGATQAICNAAPMFTSLCSTLYIPSILKSIGSMTLSSIIGGQLRDVFHSVLTKPFWGHMDRAAEHAAVVDATPGNKNLLVSYNASQVAWKHNNPLLQQEYAWRSEYIDAISGKHK